MAELPFVAVPPGDAGQVMRVAAEAARQWGLPAPELIRLSMTGVCGAGADVVLRVCRTTAPPELALRLAMVLVDIGVRVPAPRRDEVLTIDGLAVVAIERLDPVDAPVDWAEVGRMVRRVHDLDPAVLPVGLPLPRGLDFPWWQLDGWLEELTPDVDEAALAGMRSNLDRHRPALTAARDAPLVVCHGDVHAGNVIQTETGPVLVDWDLLCHEPAGWDHAALRTWADRWGGDAGAYDDFARGADEHLDDDPFAIAVADLRLVAATLMRVRASRTDPSAVHEARQRLRFWRGDPSAPMWRAV